MSSPNTRSDAAISLSCSVTLFSAARHVLLNSLDLPTKPISRVKNKRNLTCFQLKISSRPWPVVSEHESLSLKRMKRQHLSCNLSVEGTVSFLIHWMDLLTLIAVFQWNVKDGGEPTLEDVLQPGKNMLAAGYCMYGSSCTLVLSTGSGVSGFTLDPSLGEFILTHPDIKIPKKGKIYSVNEGNAKNWDGPTAKYVELNPAIFQAP
ncbi:Fructose-1,6-bisphosphatase [Actinidia chinensis var. chinensis]|uniref:fructose-bisphosphatase n=1 Tax=Actinidia chinensis var. chinensis TaxID=1590841 RepID=A0A2R6QYJ6_ACTCC|nr:Fructose-1,6-bisphosphatase [Actinidia chinensis var. chinensis]